MAASGISPQQRYTRGRPCPICDGYDGLRRGKAIRCSGYISADGAYAYCTREEYGGALAPNLRTAPPAYAHRLHGPCRCGVTHGPALAPSATRSTRRRPSSRRSATPAPSPRAPTSRAPVPATPDALARMAPTGGDHPTQFGNAPQAVYDYLDAGGTLRYQVRRYPEIDIVTGEIVGKAIRQYRPDPAHRGRWIANLDGVHPLPYRLPELLAADAGAPVYIGEGEKCVEALRAVGLVATCNSGGAGKWGNCAEMAREALRGRHVVILPDNDPDAAPGKPASTAYVGQRHALDVAAHLDGAAASIQVLMLPGLAPKGDVADWLGDGHTAEHLAELAATAPHYAPGNVAAIFPYLAQVSQAPAPTPAPTPAHAPIVERPGRPTPRSASTRPPRERVPLLPGTPEQHARMTWLEINDYFTTAERDYLYSYVERGAQLDAGEGLDGDAGASGEHEGEGEGEGERRPGYYRAVNTWGMPQLVGMYRVDLGGERPRDEVVYQIAWSTDPGAGVHDVTGEQLADGSCWAIWPGVPISARRERDMWANIVKAQARAFAIPTVEGRTATGLHYDRLAGEWLYLAQDGRCMNAAGERAPVPLAGYDLAADHPRRARAIADLLPALPAPAPTRAQVAELLAFYAQVSPNGHLAITVGASLRALVSSVVPPATALLAEGEAGSGKTSSAQHGRGVALPSPYGSEADAHFNSTATNVEQVIAPLRDVPAVLDNFRIKPGATAKEIHDLAEMLDRVIIAAESGNEMRGRGGRLGRAQKGRHVETLMLINGEKLPAILVSTLRRIMYLPYTKGVDLDVDAMAAREADYQPHILGMGHSVLRMVLAALDRDAGDLRARIEAREGDYTRRLMAVIAERPPAGEVYRSIPANWARILTGWWLAGEALDMGGELVEAAYPAVERYMLAQVQLAANGGPSSVTAEWIGDVTRAELGAAGHSMVRKLSGAPLEPGDVAGLLVDWGYTGIGGLDGTPEKWIPRGNADMLAALSDDGLTLYIRSDRWRELLRRRALAERIPWEYTAQNFAGMIARLGLSASPASNTSEAREGRHAVVKRIAGKPERCIAVPVAALCGGDDPLCAPPIGDEKSGNSGNSGNDPSPAQNSSAPTSVTARYRLEMPAVTAVTTSGQYAEGAEMGASPGMERGEGLDAPQNAPDMAPAPVRVVRRRDDDDRVREEL